MTRYAAAALAALMLLLLARPQAAHADANFGITPDKKLAKALADLADTCFECGDKAKGKGLYTWARSYFNHALEYDTDHKQTRRVMGYERKKGTWVLEEDMVPKEDNVPADKVGERVQKLAEETLPLREKAANTLWLFVEDTKLPPAQRMLAFYHTLRIFPEHRGAQKAARTLPGASDFKHHLDDEGDTKRELWIQRASEGELIETETPYEQKSGIKFAKRKTEWLVLHMDIGEKGADWAKVLLQYAEASRAHVFELLGAEPPKPPAKDDDRLHYSVFYQQDRYARFVEKCSGITDDAHRKEAGTQGGTPVYTPYGAAWHYPRLDNDFGLRDGLAHDLASKEIFRFCGGEGAYWLARGLGYLNSTHMNGSTMSRFYAVKATGVIDSGGRESLPGLGNGASGWRVEVGMRVTAGTDVKLSQLAKVRIADFNNEDAAAAFCFTDYLVTAQKAKLAEFLKACYDERAKRYRDKKDPETASEIVQRLYTTLETDEESFQQAFRTWVLANYFTLP